MAAKKADLVVAAGQRGSEKTSRLFWELSDEQAAMVLNRANSLQEARKREAARAAAAMATTVDLAAEPTTTKKTRKKKKKKRRREPFFSFGKDTARELCGRDSGDGGSGGGSTNLTEVMREQGQEQGQQEQQEAAKAAAIMESKSSPNAPLCKLAIVAPVHPTQLFELEWVAGTIVEPYAPCVVSRHFGGMGGPPRDADHVVIVFSRVSSKSMVLNSRHK